MAFDMSPQKFGQVFCADSDGEVALVAQRSASLNVKDSGLGANNDVEGGTVLSCASLNWFTPKEGWPAGQHDVVLAADVLYDKTFAMAGKWQGINLQFGH